MMIDEISFYSKDFHNNHDYDKNIEEEKMFAAFSLEEEGAGCGRHRTALARNSNQEMPEKVPKKEKNFKFGDQR